MQWDLINNPWLWSGAAIFVILVVLLVAFKFRSGSKPKPSVRTPDQQESWTPTGRIDFTEIQGKFALQAEDTRVTNGMTGVEHRELRWRRATLEEARAVTMAYHAQRSLVMTPSYVVKSASIIRPQNSDFAGEHREAQSNKESLLEDIAHNLPKDGV